MPEGGPPQYQRAVTPTLDMGQNESGGMRGKVLGTGSRGRLSSGGARRIGNGVAAAKSNNPFLSRNFTNGNTGVQPAVGTSVMSEMNMNIQGRSAVGAGVIGGVPTAGGSAGASGTSSKRGVLSGTNMQVVQQQQASSSNADALGAAKHAFNAKSVEGLLNMANQGQKYDIIPLMDEVPADGIMFARVRNQPETLVVFRTPEERTRNPERLNLDRRQLDFCPYLEYEHRLRLLNYQNNNIAKIQHLENLPNLIFLDMYNNRLTTLDGPVSCARGLRVLMAGKNRLTNISNLSNLKKLDVLDLHSNEIKHIAGMEALTDLRVLNLAGNMLSAVEGLSKLSALTELNLRRNRIEIVKELDALPALQRIFLSHNRLTTVDQMAPIFNVRYLIELSLDGNPLSELDPLMYRAVLVDKITGLKHLDLKRVTDEERIEARRTALQPRPVQYIMASEVTTVEVRSPPKLEAGVGLGLTAEGAAAIVDSAAAAVAAGVEGQGRVGAGAAAAGAMAVGDAAASGAAGQATSAKNAFVSQWTSLARHGRLGPTHGHMFELEPLTMDDKEKSLVIVGDAWEWPTHSRRALASVVEVSLLYVRFDTVVHKFLANLSMVPGIRVLRCRYNDLTTLAEVRCICEFLESTQVDHLVIQDAPIAKFSYLEGFVATQLPTLHYFNGVSIFSEDRGTAKDLLRPFIQIPAMEQQMTDHCSITQCVGISQPVGSRRVSCWGYIPPDDSRAAEITKDQTPMEKLKAFWANCNRSASRLSGETQDVAAKKVRALRDLPRAFHTVVQQIVADTVEGLSEFHSV